MWKNRREKIIDKKIIIIRTVLWTYCNATEVEKNKYSTSY